MAITIVSASVLCEDSTKFGPSANDVLLDDGAGGTFLVSSNGERCWVVALTGCDPALKKEVASLFNDGEVSFLNPSARDLARKIKSLLEKK